MTPPTAAQTALLQRLADESFVPPEDAVPGSADLIRDSSPGPEAEVAAFTVQFWSLAPIERRARWEELATRHRTDAAASIRLRRLAPGVDLLPVVQLDPVAEELAAKVRELFLLPSRELAVRRAEWLIEQSARFDALIAASRQVLRTDMPTARLDHRLFTWFAEQKPLTPVPAWQPSGGTWPHPAKARDEFYAPNPPPTAQRATAEGGVSWGKVVVGIWLVVMVLRAIGAVFSPERPTPATFKSPDPYQYRTPATYKGPASFPWRTTDPAPPPVPVILTEKR